MNYLRIESELISSVLDLNGNQKSDVLQYIKTMTPAKHSQRRYRRKAMKQIREAIEGL